MSNQYLSYDSVLKKRAFLLSDKKEEEIILMPSYFRFESFSETKTCYRITTLSHKALLVCLWGNQNDGKQLPIAKRQERGERVNVDASHEWMVTEGPCSGALV
jgi:hypothetical protein